MSFVKEDLIEGPLDTEYPVEWVSIMLFNSKKWDPSCICLTLDTRMMMDVIKQADFPIPKSEQSRQEFIGSERFTVLNMNHAFHQMEFDKEFQQLFIFNTPVRLYKFKRLVQGISQQTAMKASGGSSENS